MTTSGSTNYSTNRDSLIKAALRIVGGVAQGETPSSDQYSEAAEALNFITKALQTDGLPLWEIKQFSVPLTATSSFTIGEGQTINTPKPLKVQQAFLHNSLTNIDIPMRIITRDEYNRLGNKTTTGQPIQIFYEPLNTYGVLHLFPVPNSYSIANTQVVLVYQRPTEDFDSSTDEPDFPQEWFECLKWMLADSLAPEYGVSIYDRQDISKRAIMAHQQVLSFGTEEGSFMFQPDRRDW